MLEKQQNPENNEPPSASRKKVLIKPMRYSLPHLGIKQQTQAQMEYQLKSLDIIQAVLPQKNKDIQSHLQNSLKFRVKNKNFLTPNKLIITADNMSINRKLNLYVKTPQTSCRILALKNKLQKNKGIPLKRKNYLQTGKPIATASPEKNNRANNSYKLNGIEKDGKKIDFNSSEGFKGSFLKKNEVNIFKNFMLQTSSFVNNEFLQHRNTTHKHNNIIEVYEQQEQIPYNQPMNNIKIRQNQSNQKQYMQRIIETDLNLLNLGEQLHLDTYLLKVMKDEQKRKKHNIAKWAQFPCIDQNLFQ